MCIRAQNHRRPQHSACRPHCAGRYQATERLPSAFQLSGARSLRACAIVRGRGACILEFMEADRGC